MTPLLPRAAAHQPTPTLFEVAHSMPDKPTHEQGWNAHSAGLLAKKAVLLVTNQLQYARDARAVVFLEAGRVAACGTYAELLPCKGFANLLKEYEARGRPASPPGPARRGFSDPLLGLWARGLPALPPGLAPARPGPVRSAGLPGTLHLSDLAPACAACTHAVLACGQLRSQLRFLLQWYSPCGSRWPAPHPGRPLHSLRVGFSGHAACQTRRCAGPGDCRR